MTVMRWERGSCACSTGPLESEVTFDRNGVERCPECYRPLGGDLEPEFHARVRRTFAPGSIVNRYGVITDYLGFLAFPGPCFIPSDLSERRARTLAKFGWRMCPMELRPRGPADRVTKHLPCIIHVSKMDHG